MRELMVSAATMSRLQRKTIADSMVRVLVPMGVCVCGGVVCVRARKRGSSRAHVRSGHGM